MLWFVRFRTKEQTPCTEAQKIDTYILKNVLPAFKGIIGVKSARAFHSIHGQIVFVVELDQTSTLDVVIKAPEMDSACRKLTEWLVREAGAELMWEVTPESVVHCGISLQ